MNIDMRKTRLEIAIAYYGGKLTSRLWSAAPLGDNPLLLTARFAPGQASAEAGDHDRLTADRYALLTVRRGVLVVTGATGATCERGSPAERISPRWTVGAGFRCCWSLLVISLPIGMPPHSASSYSSC